VEEDEMSGAWSNLALIAEKRNACRILVGTLGRKRLLGGFRCRWDDNIKIGWNGIYRIHVAQSRDQWCALVNMIMDLRVP
jgi:hypothetical protein